MRRALDNIIVISILLTFINSIDASKVMTGDKYEKKPIKHTKIHD